MIFGQEYITVRSIYIPYIQCNKHLMFKRILVIEACVLLFSLMDFLKIVICKERCLSNRVEDLAIQSNTPQQHNSVEYYQVKTQ